MADCSAVALFFLAITGYIVFHVLYLPTPAMLGPFAIVILAMYLGSSFEPVGSLAGLVLQTLLGIHIGVLVERKVFRDMRLLLIPSIVMIIWTLLITFGLGSVLIFFFDMDIATALLSTAPSGMSETGLLAVSVNADVGVVSIFQLSRFVLTIIMFPLAVRLQEKANNTSRKRETYSQVVFRRINFMADALKSSIYISMSTIDAIPYLITIIVGLIGGSFGLWLNIPAGAMMGSFAAVAIVSLAGGKLRTPPKAIRTLMQMGIGVTIAINVMQEKAYSIHSLLIPVAGFTVIMFLSAFINALILKRLNGWDNISSILAAAPAGMSPMTVLAYDHSDRPLEVSLLHMTRLITVKMIILPTIVMVLMNR